MFGANYLYYDGPGGMRFCFNVAPTFVCPNAELTKPLPKDEADDEAFYAPDGTPWASPGEAVRLAAADLGMDALKLARMIRKAHHSFTHTRERVNGTLTDRCECCGTKMDRLGFRVWTERPKTQEELTSEDRVSSKVAERLGFSGERTVTLRSAYVDTKREAKQWCLDERATARAVAAEEESA